MLIRQGILFLQKKKDFGKSIVGMLKRKFVANITNSYIRGSLKVTNNDFSILATATTKEEEEHSCWCFLCVDQVTLEAKIVHKGRGKFKILNDEYGGRYINKIVDASDVIRCIVEI